jgi:hypothetical protein
VGRKRTGRRPIAAQVIEPRESTLLDLIDRLLDKGVAATGDLMLGVAGVDLVYVRVSALLCAADRVRPGARTSRRRKAARHRRR